MTLLAKQGKVLGLGKGSKFCISRALFGLPGFLHVLALHLEVLTSQTFRNYRLQSFGQLSHELAQPPPRSGRHAQSAQSLRRIEIVLATLIKRRRPTSGNRMH